MAPENETEKPPGNDSAEAPSVEAEFVDAEFTDASAAGRTGGTGGEAGAAGSNGPARLKVFGIQSPLSPGVTLFTAFAALVVVAIIVFLVWRAQSAPPETASPAGAADKPAIEQSAEDVAREEAAPPAPASQSKITNAIPADAKSAVAGAIDPEAAPASARGLPPAPSAGSQNIELQRAAKEAMRAAGADTGDAIDLGPPPAEPEIKFETPGAERSEEPIDRRAADAASDQPSAPASESAATEIAALRLSFERALAERDARANAEIADVKSRLDTMQTSPVSAPDSRAAAAAIAFVSLERAAASGGPYTEELDLFARLKPDSALANRLRASAAQGAPTLAGLKTAFDPAARAALAAAAREEATGWFSSILARLPQLISMRPAQPQAGSKPQQVISRAESALGRSDLSAAVSELGVLQGAAATEFGPWIAGARARLEIDETIASLNGALMSELQN